jgi:hypothetical protein
MFPFISPVQAAAWQLLAHIYLNDLQDTTKGQQPPLFS